MFFSEWFKIKINVDTPKVDSPEQKIGPLSVLTVSALLYFNIPTSY